VRATAVLDAEARAIRAEPGPQLVVAAHPGLTYAYQARELVNSDRRAGPRYVEIWNGEAGMNFEAGGDWPGVQAIWNRAIDLRGRVFGVASDDSTTSTAARSRPTSTWPSPAAAGSWSGPACSSGLRSSPPWSAATSTAAPA
jgi:hypothetical protein